MRRFQIYGTEARARQVRALDTFALPYLIESLDRPESDDPLVHMRLTARLEI